MKQKIGEIKLIKSTFFNEDLTKRQLNKFVSGAPILSFSEQCQQFEKNFSRYQGRKESVFVNSGSSANLAMIQALLNLKKIKRSDAVGFSTLTWSTNVMPIIQLGLRPVPIDVELDTLNVSYRTLISALERRKKKIKVLFITNLLGFCDDLEKIAEYCKKENIILIEDNCESLGTVYKKKKLGNYGLASSFSFYVGHHMSTVEGGMVCTDDREFALMLRIVRAHGWDRNLASLDQDRMRDKFKVNSTFYSRYTFYDLGYNLRPTEIAGFLGNNQLKYIEKIVDIRRKNFLKFAQAIYAQQDKYYPIRFDHIDLVSNFAVPVICRSVELRQKLVKACAGVVEIRPIVGGDMTQQPFFKKHVSLYKPRKNMNSLLIHNQGLYFGNNPDMTQEEISRIIGIFTSTT
jgi:CDP-4-dehydro-6-deoxyglucose reductase, E1